jgi:hypothetical protein
MERKQIYQHILDLYAKYPNKEKQFAYDVVSLVCLSDYFDDSSDDLLDDLVSYGTMISDGEAAFRPDELEAAQQGIEVAVTKIKTWLNENT